VYVPFGCDEKWQCNSLAFLENWVCYLLGVDLRRGSASLFVFGGEIARSVFLQQQLIYYLISQ
jgi:hypothetical protein